MEGQHAADKLLSINRLGIRRGIYIFRLPVSFATRRVFFLFSFLSYILLCHAVSLLRSLYFEASRLFLAKRDDDTLFSVRAIDISRVEHSVTGSSVTFPSFEAASRRIPF